MENSQPPPLLVSERTRALVQRTGGSLSIREAATILKVSEQFVTHMLCDGALIAFETAAGPHFIPSGQLVPGCGMHPALAKWLPALVAAIGHEDAFVFIAAPSPFLSNETGPRSCIDLLRLGESDRVESLIVDRLVGDALPGSSY